MWKGLRILTKDQSGSAAMEYALIAALVSVVGVLAYENIGLALQASYYGLTTPYLHP